MPRCYLDFCRLACGKMKVDELVKTDPYHIDDLQNRHKLPFAKLYLDACLSHLEDKPPLMLNRINIMCNYVSDHIGVKTAEDLCIDPARANRSLLAAQNVHDLVRWSGGLYQPPGKFKNW